MIADFEKEYKKSGADTAVLLRKIERLKNITMPISFSTLDKPWEK